MNDINDLLLIEQSLYSNLRVVEKYDLLEKMRTKIDYLYNNDRETYEFCKNKLKTNTWDALEDAWTLWNPTPKSNGSWGGANNMTFTLSPSNDHYNECYAKNFTQCSYDIHGEPDFGRVTYPGSIVDISDLYDTLSIDVIKKRGGGRNSLQEIAQDRISASLQNDIVRWAKNNNVEYDPYWCFYNWRDALNLVPHEDTNCRTMRLVFRPAHEAFKHRGGIANAINIKRHF